MGLLDFLFGKKDPVTRLRKAVASENWAEALTFRDDIDVESLGSNERLEIDKLFAVAGDSLARVNMEEAMACLRSGEINRADEHFELASRQVCSKELAKEISKARKAGRGKVEAKSAKTSDRPAPVVPQEEAVPLSTEGEGQFDAHIQLELILSSYPPEWVPRYEKLQGPLLKAFLIAHQGGYQEAVKAFNAVGKEDRDDIYYFELGALYARSRKNQLARKALQQALDINNGHMLALDTLVRLEMQANKTTAAEKVLMPVLDAHPGEPHAVGLWALVSAQKGDIDKCIELGREAIAAGNKDPELTVVLATLLERKEELKEAETLLRKLGPLEMGNVHLGELLLRQNRELDKLLELFKKAMAQDGENPRWKLRTAQTLLAKGWIKDAEPMLASLAELRDIPDVLKMEIAHTIKALQERQGK